MSTKATKKLKRAHHQFLTIYYAIGQWEHHCAGNVISPRITKTITIRSESTLFNNDVYTLLCYYFMRHVEIFFAHPNNQF